MAFARKPALLARSRPHRLGSRVVVPQRIGEGRLLAERIRGGVRSEKLPDVASFDPLDLSQQFDEVNHQLGGVRIRRVLLKPS